jgi:hypothetical protein
LEGEAAAEESCILDVHDAGDAYDAAGISDAVGTGDAAGTSGAAGASGGAGISDSSHVATKSPLFNCLPLDVYLDWLASNIVNAVDCDPELETPALRMPKQLPEAWLRYGLNAANWKEAVRTISRRFRWLERTASAMRRDCRRFVADSSPPAG